MSGMHGTKHATVEAYRFADDGGIPNNPSLPLLLYRGVLPPGSDLAAAFERRFGENGWGGGWRNGIYGHHHYHSNAHEVLGIAAGRARVRLGGEAGMTVEVRAGDMVVIPAGVGHRNEGASPDLLVIGAYPDGRDPDIRTGRPDERPDVIGNIAAVAMPGTDPFYGKDGPLLRKWSWK